MTAWSPIRLWNPTRSWGDFDKSGVWNPARRWNPRRLWGASAPFKGLAGHIHTSERTGRTSPGE